MDTEQHKIKIFGQEIPYPNSWPAVIGVLIISVLIGFISWVVLVCAGHERISVLSNMMQHRFSSKGIHEESTSYRIIQFWTPSDKTQVDLAINDGTQETLKWQKVSDEKVKTFGDRLAEMTPVAGYRRYEVTGHGRTSTKRGWWWVVTIKDNFNLDNFAKMYTEFWGNSNDIYFEEYRANEQYLR